MAVLVRLRRIVPAVVVALLREGQAGHELVGADVRRVVLDGAGGAARRGAVLLVGHVVEAVRHVRERLGVAAVGVVQEHRAVRVVGLGADVLGQGADHVIGDRHIRIGRIGLHIDIQTIQADRRHVLADDFKRIGVVVGVGGVIDRLAQIGHIVAEAFDGDLLVVDAADELDAARMQIRSILGLQLVIERLGLLLLTGRHVTEHVDHIHAIRDVIHRDPVLIRQIRIHTLHRHITPRAIVHHEVTAVRVRDTADVRGCEFVGICRGGRRDDAAESHRRGGDARGNGGDTTFHRRSAGKQRMVCTHRFPFSMLEVQVSPAPVATVPRLLLRNGRGTAFPSSTRPTDKSGLGRTGTLSAHHPVRHGGQDERRRLSMMPAPAATHATVTTITAMMAEPVEDNGPVAFWSAPPPAVP